MEVTRALSLSPPLALSGFAESSTVENGKLGSHASEAPAEAKAEPDADRTNQAFLSLEQEEKGGAKASVLEVFKKVTPGHTEERLRAFQRARLRRRPSVDSSLDGVPESFARLQIWVMAFCVTFVFTVTLSVFPAVTADVKTIFSANWGNDSVTPTWCICTGRRRSGVMCVGGLTGLFVPSERFFISVCCFLTFNICDWLGRTITTFIQWVSPPASLPLFHFPFSHIDAVPKLTHLHFSSLKKRSQRILYLLRENYHVKKVKLSHIS